MSETTVGREPVQIIEMLLPRCSNVHGSSPCTATELADAKCYNSRSTCNDPANYRSRPDSNLEYDFVRSQGRVVTNTELDFTADVFVALKVAFPREPDGIIWEQGDDTNGVFVGCHNDTWFEVRAGYGGDPITTQTVQVQEAISSVAGKTLFIYLYIDHSARRLYVWAYDAGTGEFVFTGTDTATAWPSGAWSGNDDGAIGTLNTNGTFGTTFSDFNGRVLEAQFNQSDLPDPATFDTATDYKTTLYFGRMNDPLPSDNIYILPFIRSVSTVGSKINLAGTNETYEPLGQNATLTIDFIDPPHTDRVVDPYLADRSYNPLAQSTFWRKFAMRQKFGKLHARILLYDGYAGQALSAMQKREYVVNSLAFEGASGVRLHCRDILSLSNIGKAQFPVTSQGVLRDTLSTSSLVINTQGATLTDYPQTGIVRVNEELMTYTGVEENVTEDGVLLTGVGRGTNGTEAAEHDLGDTVQVCESFTEENIDSILWKLCGAADIDYHLIDFDNWLDTVLGAYYNGYKFTTLITEPTSVKALLGEVCVSAGVYLFWNERAQTVQLRGAIASDTINTTINTYTEDNHILQDFTLTERPDEYISQYWLHYNQRDPTKPLEEVSNFRNSYALANTDVEGPNKYGRRSIRTVYSRWIASQAVAASSAGRQANLRKELPVEASFSLDAKDRDLWVGDYCYLSHKDIVDQNGVLDATRLWLVLEAEEKVSGERVQYRVEEVTAAGEIFFITENAEADYAGSNPDNLMYIAPDGTIDAAYGVIQ